MKNRPVLFVLKAAMHTLGHSTLCHERPRLVLAVLDGHLLTVHLQGMLLVLTYVVPAFRLQGAHKIVIYDDASEDNSLLLQDLYHQHGRHYLKMYPVSVLEGEYPDEDNNLRLERQLKAFDHCLRREASSADWILVADVDEFIWSPKYSTIQEFLGSAHVEDGWANVGVQLTKTGMLDDTERYTYKLHKELDGTVRLTNEHGPQLLIENMVQRGPDARLGEPEAVIRDNITYCATGWCEHGPVKSFARKSALKKLGVHSHHLLDGFWGAYAEMSLITGRHFRVISEADLLYRRQSSRAWDNYEAGELDDQRTTAKTFFRAVTDRTLQTAFSRQVRKQIWRLLSTP